MSIRTSRWPAGVPCWTDLTVPDVDAAKAFYADVLGWGFQEIQADYGGYAVAQVRGAPTAGIGPRQQGSTSAWTLYLASDDANGTAAAIGAHGGTVVLPPGDVGPLGRMLIASDPTGASFGVWEAGTHIGARLVNEPGGLTWDDLRSPDPDAARAFYGAVFGHRMQALPDAGPGYATFSLPGDEAPLGGMGPMIGSEGQPAHWVVYFGVPDTAAAVTAAERGGGSVIMPELVSPYGRMASLADPTGAAFMVIETDGGSQPDRSG